MANIVEMDRRVSIERQASRWLIRIDGDQPLTDAERHTLQEWMRRSPLHRGELVRLAKRWNEANILNELFGGVEARRRDGNKLCWECLIRAMLIPSCAVLVAFVLLYSGLRSVSGSVRRTYETTTGEQKTDLLSDGSYIRLNTNSQVTVVYDNSARRIQLLRRGAVLHDSRLKESVRGHSR